MPDTHIVVPAGTQLALVLTHPIDSKVIHRGDQIYAQLTAPVTIGNRAVIPPGTFVQGRVEKMTRRGTRGELLMQSLSLVFPDGYAATIGGHSRIESGEGTAFANPGGGAKTGAIIAPMAGAGLGALIGSAAHTKDTTTLGGQTITTNTPKGIAIGSLVGSAAGAVVSIALLLRSRDFYVEVGSPMELTLTEPLTLAMDRLPESGQQSIPPVPIVLPRPRPQVVPDVAVASDHGTCYTADIPGTPPVVIPGTQATADSPGTPDTVIPGTPSVPGTAYPCP